MAYLLIGCTKNNPPVIKDFASPSDLITSEKIDNLKVIAIDPDGDKLTYSWTAERGKFPKDAQTESIQYVASSDAGIETITVKVDDGRGGVTSDSVQIPIKKARIVRLDSLAIPAGWMSGSNGNPNQFIKMEGGIVSSCDRGADCIKITYRPGGVWGGIYWWPINCGNSGTPGAWNKVKSDGCGIDVRQVGKFSEIKRILFWAKGEKGNEVGEFKIGSVDVSPKPGRSTGKIALTDQWEKYEIDLVGLSLQQAVGLFFWSSADLDNPEKISFFLDDIQFEGIE